MGDLPLGESTEPGKPRRRYYRLTPHGVQSARTLIAARQPAAAPPGRLAQTYGRWAT
ncbi:hypothetical protein GCM10027614_14770 [Micromonospora vulcania]